MALPFRLFTMFVVATWVADQGMSSPLTPPSNTFCDILIAGGTTAALSAGITAAEAATNLTVCLTEPTDELGGQLAFNPAIDFGIMPKTVGLEWGSLVAALESVKAPCYVSKACYPPSHLRSWVTSRVAKLPNLHILFRTTVRDATRNSITGVVESLKLVTRTWKLSQYGSSLTMNTNPNAEWGRLSEQIEDWYSETESVNFSKQVRLVSATVIVEATELGDVLATARLNRTQGVEIPTETSLQTDEGLTQSVVFPFFMELLPTISHSPVVPTGNSWQSSGAKAYWGEAPGGGCCCGAGNDLPPTNNTCHGKPSNGSCLWGGQCSWGGVWRYRRTSMGTEGVSPVAGVNVGDVSMQNWGHGNDMEAACLFLPSRLAASSVAMGRWVGGVNLTALRMVEDRAFGWYHTLAAGAAVDPTRPAPANSSFYTLNRDYSGTTTGLTKFPYLRDTRRAIGFDSFRLNHTSMMAVPGRPTGVEFVDRIGLGDYNFDVKPGAGRGAANGGSRPLPSYMWNATTNTGIAGHSAPFYIPFRALMVDNTPNVLTAGKTIAMTFAANTAAREHADEWSCGVGAGAAAVVMALDNMSSIDLLNKAIPKLQELLRSPNISQPLEWNSPSPPRPQSPVYVCGAARCVLTDAAAERHTYNTSTCVNQTTSRAECGALEPYEFLFFKEHWSFVNTIARARVATVLKKAEVAGNELPAREKLIVPQGAVYNLRHTVTLFDDLYYLGALTN